MIRNSILETIGKTPVVRLNRLAPEGVELFVKVEAFNPAGSVKDRFGCWQTNSNPSQPGQ